MLCFRHLHRFSIDNSECYERLALASVAIQAVDGFRELLEPLVLELGGTHAPLLISRQAAARFKFEFAVSNLEMLTGSETTIEEDFSSDDAMKHNA